MTPMALFILDALSHGEAHGHRLRVLAQEEYVDLWTDVQVGGFYAAIKRLAADGLATPVRTEAAGRYPERTVYAITDAGRAALSGARDAMLERVVFRADPFDLALSRAADLDEAALREVLLARRSAYGERRAAITDELPAIEARLSPVERHIVDHLLARLATELTWLDGLLDDLPAVVAGFDRGEEAGERG